MENEIPSRFDGTVEEVFVQKGASVGQDEPLVSIKG
ncbi:MAG: biotin/lipoyl-containing protein [Bacteroidota bacterium]